MISDDCIYQIKDRANIVEVVEANMKLTKSGSELVANCPFHNENSPSFKVSKTKQIYKCFGCGKSGDSISFIQEYKQLTYIEAIKWLANFYKIELTEVSKEPKKAYVKPVQAKSAVGQHFLNWFAGRGIFADTLKDLNVTQVNQWMPKAKANVDAICFNYFRNGELINVKYRADNKDFSLSKDAELVFYNLDAIRLGDYVVITEGEIDCLSIYQSGIKTVISVPNGAGTGNLKLDYLDNCFDWFLGKKKIVLMTDNDPAGMRLRDELARRLGYERCYKVVYPNGCKDANDILLKYGDKVVIDTINSAVEFPIEGIISMPEMHEDVLSYYDNGYPLGAKIGVPLLDEYISFMLGQFTTITGTPGAGKSEMTDFIITKLAVNHDWRFAICSFENQPSSLHVTKIAEKYTGKSFAFRQDLSQRMDKVQLNNAISFVNDYFFFLNLNQIDVTLDGILAKAKELVMRKGIKGLLIDPWNYIEHKRAVGQTETDYVSECLTKIKAFCIQNMVHIFLIAHPTKMPKVNGKYEVPTLYSISGSAHFYNKTDNGITVYRDYTGNTVEVYIQKVRYGWLGKIGGATFVYNTMTRQYEDPNAPVFVEPPIPDNPAAGITRNYQNNQKLPEGFWNDTN